MNRSALPGLLREAYKLRKSGSESGDIYKRIIEIVKNDAGRYGIKENDSAEFVQEFIFSLLKSFISEDENIVWEQNIEENEESDSNLLIYYYRIIRSTKRIIGSIPIQNEKINLYKAVRDVTNSLVEENILRQLNKGKDIYLYNAKYEEYPGDVFQETVSAPFQTIRNPNGSINREKIKELIVFVFLNSLENKLISLSNLVDSISECTGVGIQGRVYIADHVDERAEGEAVLMLNIKQLVDIWLARIKENLTEREANLYVTVFYFWYGCNYTLTDISAMFNKSISKSTVHNYIKKLIEYMRISEDIFNDEYFKYYSEALLERMKNEYNIYIETKG